MRSTIVTPLSEIAGERIPLADRAVGEFRVAAQQRGMTEQLVRQSSSEVTQIITSMKAILENVRDMAEFHEALRDLKAIFDEQQQNLERTRKLQKNELFDDILK
jgi:predicted translin family RNA/ssDNA-binding protein